MRVTNGNFDSCMHLHELHESKIPFATRIEFFRSKLSLFVSWGFRTRQQRGHFAPICSKLSNFSAHVSGVTVAGATAAAVR